MAATNYDSEDLSEIDLSAPLTGSSSYNQVYESPNAILFRQLFFPLKTTADAKATLDSFLTHEVLCELTQARFNFIHEMQNFYFPTDENETSRHRYKPDTQKLRLALSTTDINRLTALDYAVTRPLKESNDSEQDFVAPSLQNRKDQHHWLYHWLAAGAIATNVGNDGFSTLDRYVLNNEFPPHTCLDQAIALLNYGAEFIKTPLENPVRLRIQRRIEQQKQSYQDTLLEQIGKLKTRRKGRIRQDPLHQVLTQKIDKLAALYDFIENSGKEAPLERSIYQWIKYTPCAMEQLAKHEYATLSKEPATSYTLVLEPLQKHYFYRLSASENIITLKSVIDNEPATILSSYYISDGTSMMGEGIDNLFFGISNELDAWSKGDPFAEDRLKTLIHQHYKRQTFKKLFTLAEKEKNIMTVLEEYIDSIDRQNEAKIKIANLFIFIESLYAISQTKSSYFFPSDSRIKELLSTRVLLLHNGERVGSKGYTAIFTEIHPVTQDTLFLHFLKTCNPKYKSNNDIIIAEFLNQTLQHISLIRGISSYKPSATELASKVHSIVEQKYSALDTYTLAFQATERSSINNAEFSLMIHLLNCGFRFNRVSEENTSREGLEGLVTKQRTDYLKSLTNEIDKLQRRDNEKAKKIVAALKDLRKYIRHADTTLPVIFLVSIWRQSKLGYADAISSVPDSRHIVESIFRGKTYSGIYSSYDYTNFTSCFNLQPKEPTPTHGSNSQIIFSSSTPSTSQKGLELREEMPSTSTSHRGPSLCHSSDSD